jgi:hypothetical protein
MTARRPAVVFVAHGGFGPRYCSVRRSLNWLYRPFDTRSRRRASIAIVVQTNESPDVQPCCVVRKTLV